MCNKVSRNNYSGVKLYIKNTPYDIELDSKDYKWDVEIKEPGVEYEDEFGIRDEVDDGKSCYVITQREKKPKEEKSDDEKKHDGSPCPLDRVYLISPVAKYVYGVDISDITVEGKYKEPATVYKFLCKYKQEASFCYLLEFRDGHEEVYDEKSQIAITFKDKRRVPLEYFKETTAYDCFNLSIEKDVNGVDTGRCIDGSISIIDRCISTPNKNNTIAERFLFDGNFELEEKDKEQPIIFPFGCNGSQIEAVENALSSRLSIIEGPPGTGKTQTILNIITNLLVRKKTVLVISNSNMAVLNVSDKLKEEGLDFLVAQLGNSTIKKGFKKSFPKKVEDKFWDDAIYDADSLEKLESELKKGFALKCRVAELRKSLDTLKLERSHFKEDNGRLYPSLLPREEYSFEKLFQFMQDLKRYMIEGLYVQENKRDWFMAIRHYINEAVMIVKNSLMFEFCGFFPPLQPVNDISLTSLLFEVRIAELQNELRSLEGELAAFSFGESEEKLLGFEKMLDAFGHMSMSYLKGCISRDRVLGDKTKGEVDKYIGYEGSLEDQRDFTLDYPIVTSSTYSAYNVLPSYVFDYVIVDESSTVSLDKGVLAMYKARNAVIVGDIKQLPNVVSEKKSNFLNSVYNRFCGDIPEYLNCNKSFLGALKEFSEKVDIPVRLLREHYRCHPKIIEFCNQYYYDNELIIMTKDLGEKNVLGVIRTEVPTTSSSSAHQNAREANDVLSLMFPKDFEANNEKDEETLENFGLSDLKEFGIITPFKDQVKMIKNRADKLGLWNSKEWDKTFCNDVSTVHKFQGQGRDTVIMSSVDDVVKKDDFVDNSQMWNVAVSRAKKKFVLVCSNKDPELGTNIEGFLRYARYQNVEERQGPTHSIFNFLYSGSKNDELIEKILEKDNENLTEEDFEALSRESAKFGKKESPAELLAYLEFYRMLKNLIVSKTLGLERRKLLKEFITVNEGVKKLLYSESERKYMQNGAHVDFLFFRTIDKSVVCCIEIDGHTYHGAKANPKVRENDVLKDSILKKAGITLFRIDTIESCEKDFDEIRKFLEDPKRGLVKPNYLNANLEPPQGENDSI